MQNLKFFQFEFFLLLHTPTEEKKCSNLRKEEEQAFHQLLANEGDHSHHLQKLASMGVNFFRDNKKEKAIEAVANVWRLYGCEEKWKFHNYLTCHLIDWEGEPGVLDKATINQIIWQGSGKYMGDFLCKVISLWLGRNLVTSFVIGYICGLAYS